jgi:hypothetical protein
VGNTSRNYHLVIVLTIALTSLWILNLSDNSESNNVSVLLEQSLPGSAMEYEAILQQQTTAPKLPEFQSDWDGGTLDTNGQSVSVELNLPDKVTVWGTIQTEYGEITSFDQIVLYSKSLGKIYTTISNLHGYYYIDGIKPALDYRVRVNPAGMYQRYVRRNVELSSAQTALSVVLQALALDVLRGRVINIEGMPVAGIGLRVKSELKDIWSSSFITDSSGRFQVENVPLGGLEFLSTFGPDVLINGLVFEGDTGSPVSLIVDQGSHRLNGQVRKDFDMPLADANVTLSWTQTGDGKHSVVKRHTRTDSSGHFAIQGLGSGEHELLLVTPAGVSYQKVIDVGHAAQDITINLAQSLPSN